MKLLDRILGKNKIPNNAGQTYEEAVRQRQEEAAAQYQRDKLAWEKENEALKLRDACYLGLDNKAFYGNYEMWLQRRAQNQLGILGAMGNQQSQMAAVQMQNYYSQNPFYITQNQLGGILGGIIR